MAHDEVGNGVVEPTLLAVLTEIWSGGVRFRTFERHHQLKQQSSKILKEAFVSCALR